MVMKMDFAEEGLTIRRNNKQLAGWLFMVCAAIFIMVVLGGITRLTHSGLSMVEWDPIMGFIPPLNQAEWEDAFQKYRQFPEYQLNAGMDLAGFKSIFWMEYIHRVWGRMIGLIFLVPFLYFLARGKIARLMIPKMVIMFVLGGMQGALGWYMVRSGLVDNPYVSQYRLTAHLIAAFMIYGYIFWIALGLLFPRPEITQGNTGPLRRFALIVTGLIAITVISGGFVAGLKAGLAYNTFPLMYGRFIPEGYFTLQPWYLNFFENIAAVQFDHRLLAEILIIVIFLLWLMSRRYRLPDRARIGFRLLVVMALVQVSLGISTLLLVVPTWLAVTHQAGALVLFSLALNACHSLGAR
ncbi:MAG TPA: COX15/CtaA family protein [Gammaproteobacteria bacterium]